MSGDCFTLTRTTSSPRPRVVIYDETGNEVSSTELPAPPDLAALQNAAVSPAGGLITWWTGHDLVVFNATELAFRLPQPVLVRQRGDGLHEEPPQQIPPAR